MIGNEASYPTVLGIVSSWLKMQDWHLFYKRDQMTAVIVGRLLLNTNNLVVVAARITSSMLAIKGHFVYPEHAQG